MTIKYSSHQYSLKIYSIIKRRLIGSGSYRHYSSRSQHWRPIFLVLNSRQFEQFGHLRGQYLFARTCEYNDCYIWTFWRIGDWYLNRIASRHSFWFFMSRSHFELRLSHCHRLYLL